VVAGWLQSAEVRDLLAACAEAFAALVPREHCPDQLAATDLGLAAAHWPDRAAWLVPAENVPDGWSRVPWSDLSGLSADERPAEGWVGAAGPWCLHWPEADDQSRAKRLNELERICGALKAVGRAMKGAGAALDPDAPLTFLALTQLLLLSFDLEAPDLELNLTAGFALGRDPTSRAITGKTVMRDDTMPARDLAPESFGRWLREERDPGSLVRDPGGRSLGRSPAVVEARREALKRTLANRPGRQPTVTQLADLNTPAGKAFDKAFRVEARKANGEKDVDDFWRANKMARRRTLQRDRKALHKQGD
jgi:hypothetical protein